MQRNDVETVAEDFIQSTQEFTRGNSYEFNDCSSVFVYTGEMTGGNDSIAKEREREHVVRESATTCCRKAPIVGE